MKAKTFYGLLYCILFVAVGAIFAQEAQFPIRIYYLLDSGISCAMPSPSECGHVMGLIGGIAFLNFLGGLMAAILIWFMSWAKRMYKESP